MHAQYGDDDGIFQDRTEAAKILAKKLLAFKGRKDIVVVAIPRGGVVIGAILAKELSLPLDIVLTKKVGHPLVPELAIGVVNLGGEVIDKAVVERDRIPREYLEKEIASIRALLRRRYDFYRGGHAPVPLKDKTAIIADDGIATGHTMIAAIKLARHEGARAIIVAVPVGPRGAIERLGALADEVVCVLRPEAFWAIGEFYENFDQVSDEEAIRLLRGAAYA